MYPLVDAIHVLLKGRPWDYAFCGGWAIDLFLGRQTRRHSDVDLLAYWPDRDRMIEDMKALGFTVYEMLGGGLAHRITDVRVQRRIKRNIFCIRQGCDLVRLKEAGEPEIFAIDFRRIGQTQPDFLEFLFNDRTPEEFLYARDPSIRRDRRKAILSTGGIPYLTPELCLLYKSTDIQREGYQQDCEQAAARMDSEQKARLAGALARLYPQGHPWIAVLDGGAFTP